MSKKKIGVIVSPADREKARPILDALKNKGFRLADEKDAKAAVLLFLSEAFAKDEEAQEHFFTLDSAGRMVIPVDLDGAQQSELVRSALIARNAIATQGRTIEEIAARAADAVRGPYVPVWRPVWRFLGAAAVLLALGLGIWFWRANAAEEPAATPEPTEETALPELDRFGLSAEDLEQIGSMVIIGDRVYPYTVEQYRESFYYPEWTDYASASWEWDGQHFYSFEDGGEILPARYDDLGVLALMPKLTKLTLVNVESENMPSLASLKFLDSVQIYSCSLGGCEWLAGTDITNVSFGSTDVSDFSPLSTCDRLAHVSINTQGGARSDLSGFAPPNMKDLSLWSDYDTALDLSALSACKSIRVAELFDLSVRDLDFLSGSEMLSELNIRGLHELRDVSALSGMKSLQKLSVYDCTSLSDISALGGMTSLRELRIDSDEIRDYSPIGTCRNLTVVFLYSNTLRDASFLSGLSLLREVHLFLESLRDVDFLPSLNTKNGLHVTLNGDVQDYSGLAGVERYDYLSLGPNRPTLERALVYLQDADIRELSLTNVKAADWALVPRPKTRLWIHDSNLRDLSGFPAWELGRIDLQFTDLPHLRSLQGIEAASGLDSGMPAIEIRNCPLLTELGLPRKSHLRQLTVADGLIAPSLQGISLNALRLENIVELEDLSCLAGMDLNRRCNFELVGLEKLTDLSMLRNFRGETLLVPPQLAEQAQELCESDRFQRWDVAYPEGGWRQDEVEVVLESLTELQTMPKALLRHVKRLCIAGDRLINVNAECWCYENWDKDGRMIPMLHLADGDIEMNRGAISDLSSLADLTGLEELMLWNQPLKSLEGIQIFTELRRAELEYCEDLKDVSAVFTLQELEDLSLHFSGAESIRGVQNLTELRRLNIAFCGVTDISPLAESRFDAAERGGEGFCLRLSGRNIEDYGPLGAIGNYSELCFEDNAEPSRWTEALKDVKIGRLQFFNSDFDSESFAAFVRKHHELRVLWMPWNESIDDLTVLLELPELETVDVSFSMEEAVASLEGKEYNFELIVEQPN